MVRWTFVFLITAVIVFFLEFYVPIDWNYFSFTPKLALERPWTFITSIFLHANFPHLFFNMFALFMFGLFLESRIGPRHYLILFFLAGIFGSIGYMITASDPSIPAIGASGAIYGILGASAVLMPRMIVWVMGIPMPMVAAAFLWVVLELLGLFSAASGIAHAAHLGGIVVGFAYGFYIRRIEKKRYRHIFKQFNLVGE